MKQLLNVIYRGLRLIKMRIWNWLTTKYAYLLMKILLVEVGSGFKSRGVPSIYLNDSGKFIIGKNIIINNTVESNPIGRNFKCIFRIHKNALLKIGDNVGLSSTSIICHEKIIISDNVKIGGNVCIYDTDFHPLESEHRNRQEDEKMINKKHIFIDKNVFIGAHVTILKGVHIGKNSIIGACSVVSKNVPENEIWAGNPARFIKKIDDN